MEIISKSQLSVAVESLRRGGILVFPTETSYGLGCDATNQEAVNKIFKIKGRKGNKPLLVVVPTVEMAKKYLVWNELLEKLANKYWPGPLTVVGKYNTPQPPSRGDRLNPSSQEGREVLAKGVVSPEGTIALRVSAHPIPKFLSGQLGKPVVATSANIADAGDIYDSKKIIEIFADKKFQPDALIDAGKLPRNPPTTVVSVLNNKLKILRQGELKVE